MLTTKFSHWKYENEVRIFVDSNKIQIDYGIYFQKFDESVRLTDIIVGCRSLLTRADLDNFLGDKFPDVEVRKARLAFKSFRVVKQNKAKLWP